MYRFDFPCRKETYRCSSIILVPAYVINQLYTPETHCILLKAIALPVPWCGGLFCFRTPFRTDGSQYRALSSSSSGLYPAAYSLALFGRTYPAVPVTDLLVPPPARPCLLPLPYTTTTTSFPPPPLSAPSLPATWCSAWLTSQRPWSSDLFDTPFPSYVRAYRRVIIAAIVLLKSESPDGSAVRSTHSHRPRQPCNIPIRQNQLHLLSRPPAPLEAVFIVPHELRGQKSTIVLYLKTCGVGSLQHHLQTAIIIIVSTRTEKRERERHLPKFNQYSCRLD